MYQKIYQMVQGEIHSSDSDVALEFFLVRHAHILICPFIFALISPPPFYIAKTFDLGQGHNNP